MLRKLFNKILGKPYEKMSFSDSFKLTGQPIVIFNQGKKTFNFLLDSGSTDCIIDSNVLDKIEHEKINAVTTLSGMDGIDHEVPYCKITLYFNDRGYEYAYLINDMGKIFKSIKEATGVTLHGILGTKFFNEFKYVLDFDELIAYSKQ